MITGSCFVHPNCILGVSPTLSALSDDQNWSPRLKVNQIETVEDIL